MAAVVTEMLSLALPTELVTVYVMVAVQPEFAAFAVFVTEPFAVFATQLPLP